MPTHAVPADPRERTRWRRQFGENGQAGFSRSTTMIGQQHVQATFADASGAQHRRAQPRQRDRPQGAARFQEP
ncbi:hypothetical protein G6F22_021627 [Rhizopus arrhizus]|nr:hypothetical protein G6F22_021627 [Rhizopus arrhizus]